VGSWNFLTNQRRALLCIARDPGVRLRDLAAGLGITERSAHAIVADLSAAGYVVKQKHGRRNRYQIQPHLPLPEPASQEPAIGDVLALVAGWGARQEPRRSATGHEHAGISDGDQEECSGIL
jgi:predicted DNA-binding transcriptional regulator YafY